MNALSGRVAGICAILFVVCMVLGVNFGFDSPDTDAPDQEWLNWVRDDNGLVMNIIGGYLMVIAGIFFLAFISSMYQRFRAAPGGDNGWGLIMLTTGIGWAASLMIGAILIQTIPGTIKFGNGPEPTPETARWITQVGFGVFLVAGGLCAALSTAILSGLILRTKTLPAWVGYFGYLGALAMVFAVIFLPMIIFALWMLATGIVLVMRSEPAEPMPARA